MCPSYKGIPDMQWEACGSVWKTELKSTIRYFLRQIGVLNLISSGSVLKVFEKTWW